MDEKSEKILQLLKQLEVEGVKIIPVADKLKSIEEIKDGSDPTKALEDRLKQLGPGAKANDWWIEAGWKMNI